ncbi:MAG: FtsQ-type POTRA domain-containing protein [Nitrospira sp.]|nr:FtsQ-type POTRA domain-containing protein [Candidatus Manganitrophaceae bacterium]HIL33804.1 FtsQ-type POTRA domain-containing protein [Candidatus Manganitrophaceae bacterium]
MGYAISRTKKRRVIRRQKDRSGQFFRHAAAMGKSLGLSVLLGMGLFVLYLGLKQGMSSSVFNVKEIRWSGLHHLKGSGIRDRLAALTGENLFYLDLADARKELLSDPWVKSVVVKKVFPDRLSIMIVERKPALVEYAGVDFQGAVGSSRRTALLDEEGVILEEGGVYPETLPRIIRFDRERFPNAAILARSLANRPGVLMDLSNPDDLLVHFTGEKSGVRKGVLHLGKRDYQERWVRYLEIENDLRDRGFSHWEVDLRFSDKAIVRRGFSVKKIGSRGPSVLPRRHREKMTTNNGGRLGKT